MKSSSQEKVGGGLVDFQCNKIRLRAINEAKARILAYFLYNHPKLLGHQRWQ